MSATCWDDAPPQATHPALDHDDATDVIVVGGGITGLTAAVLLARAGRNVTLLEAHRIGSGTTGHTSAHLTVETDTDLDALKRRVGDEGARAAVHGHRAGLERIASLDAEMGGRSGFTRVPGWLWTMDDDQIPRIERIAELYRTYGEQAEAPVDVPLPRGLRRGMRLENQALFHPVRYLHGLVELATRAGVQIHEHTDVVEWRSGSPAHVETRSGHTVEARELVLATHTPPGLVPTVQTRLAPYLSFLVVTRVPQPVPPGLYWDMEDPYHYIRTLDDGRILVGGGDIKPGTGDTRAAADGVADWAREHLGAGDVEARWSHVWFEPADGLPYVGRLPTRSGVWVATGFSGTGLTWGTFAASRIAAGILGEEDEDDARFSPSRVALVGSFDRVVEDQASVLWHMVADRLRPTGDHHPADLPPGEGRVVTIDGRKVGAYRDEGGELHGISVVCRHLGCLVAWNALDRTWDCPCHGGRYRADGTRIAGPPMGDLERRKL